MKTETIQQDRYDTLIYFSIIATIVVIACAVLLFLYSQDIRDLRQNASISCEHETDWEIYENTFEGWT